MKISVSAVIDLKDYTYAQYNGKGNKNFSKGTQKYQLKPQGYFAYRETKQKDYFVFPGLLDVEFGFTHEKTDKLFEKSDEPKIKRTELNKLFKAKPIKEPEPDLEPAYKPKIKLADKYKPVVTGPDDGDNVHTDPTSGVSIARPKNTEEHEAHTLFKPVYNVTMFARAYETDQGKLAYLTLQWNKLNALKFSSELKIPKIRFLKQLNVDKFRRAGHWRGGNYRELAFNRRLFLRAEFIVLMTLLHEMCHQYVDEVLHSKDRSEQGHGPEWQDCMRRVGLVPSRYNQHGDYLLTEEEQEQRDAHKELLKDALTNQGKYLLTNPISGKAAQYFNTVNQVWVHGVLITKMGKYWAIKSEESGNNYMRVPPSWLMQMDKKPSDLVYAKAAELKKSIEQGAEYKKMLREMKKNGTKFKEFKF